jgi:hypothetical protein
MLKAFSKSISKSILAFVKGQLRALRRKALQQVICSGFQRLEPRRVLTVQGVFDAISGNLSVNITPGGVTDATLGALNASEFYLDVNGNSSFDSGELYGAKADLKNIFVTGTSSALGNIGTFTWKDHQESTFQLGQIFASDLAKISLDVLAKVSVAQDSSLQASESIAIHNSQSPVNLAGNHLTFANGLNLDASENNASIFINLDYTLTVQHNASLRANLGTIHLSDIDANTIEVYARDGIFDSDYRNDSIDIRANEVLLSASTGSIGGPLTNILSADMAMTNQNAIEIAARTPGNLNSTLVATQGTVSIHSSEFPTSVDTNKLWISSDSQLDASDLSGLSSRITDLALISNPISSTLHGIVNLPNFLSVTGDLRIQAHEVTASDSTIDLQADRVLWNTRQEAAFSITANQLDAESQASILIHSNQALTITDLNSNQIGLSGSGNITISSKEVLSIDSRISTSSAGSIVLESPKTITLGANGTFNTDNANLGVFSGQDILIGSLQAGSGQVFLSASGSVLRHTPSNTSTNITASSVSIKTDGSIGRPDTMNPSFNNNQYAIIINATTLSAQAGDSIYIRDTDTLIIDRITTSLAQVTFNSSTVDRTQTLEDVTTTGRNGNVKLQTTVGDLTINPGTPGSQGISAHGSGDILLQTGNSGSVVLNADIVTQTGDITVLSSGVLDVSDRIKTSRPGTISLVSESTITVRQLTTNHSDLSVVSTREIIVGRIDAGIGSVILNTGRTINDLDSSTATTNVIASNLLLQASSRIGNDTGQGTNRGPLTTQVDKLSAIASGGIYIQEKDGVTIDRVSVSVNRVNFNSLSFVQKVELEDLTTLSNGSILLQSLNGDIVVNSGLSGTYGVNAHGTGNVLLQTLNGGTIITNSNIQSGSGHITLSSKADLVIDQKLRTSGPGTIYLESQGDLYLNSLTTNDTNLGAFATGTIYLGSVEAGLANVSLQAGVSISDNPGLVNPIHVSASKLTMIASEKIGDQDTGNSPDSNSKAILTEVTGLSARSGKGTYVQELNGVTIESISNPLQQVTFLGGVINRTQNLEDLSSTNGGPIKLQSLTGDILVNPGTAGTNGISANGSGDILLQAIRGSIGSSAPIVSGTGHISLDASGTIGVTSVQTAGSGTIYLSAGSSLTEQSIVTAGGDIQIFTAGDLILGRINAGSGRVYLQSAANILDPNTTTNSINITASALAMKALGKIGDWDRDSIPESVNRNAIGTQVGTLSAQSTSGIYIQESDAVTIDTVTVTAQKVHFNSTRTSQSQSLEDLSTTINGPVKLQSLAGNIDVNAGFSGGGGIDANGNGDVLIESLGGNITTTAAIASSTGNVTIHATGDIKLGGPVQTNSSITIHSGATTTLQSISTGGSNLQIISGGKLILGTIDAGTGRVYLQSNENIEDADTTSNSTNITASALAMRATGSIGSSDLNSTDPTTNRNAIGTQVGVLAAQSTHGIYIQQTGSVTIDGVSIQTDRVNFNSTRTVQSQGLEDLTTTGDGSVKLQSLSGNIVVNPGTASSHGITSSGSGDILLQTLSGDIASFAPIASASGYITLDSSGEMRLVSSMQTQGDVTLLSGKAMRLESTITGDSNRMIVSGGDLTLGTIDAGMGAVYLQATGNIKDFDTNTGSANIIATALAMKATGRIGDQDVDSLIPSTNKNAIGTRVSILAAESATGIYIQEADGVTIDKVSVSTDRVHFNSSRSGRSESLEDLTSKNNGSIKLQSLEGSIVVNAGTSATNSVSAHGSGDILLETVNAGTIVINSDVQSGSGHITLNAKDAMTVSDRLRTSSPGTIYLASASDITIDSLVTGTSTQILSGNHIRLGRIEVGAGSVYLQAQGDITDADASGNSTNIIADSLAMKAGGTIGSRDLDAFPVSVNRNAIGVQVAKLAAQSSEGIYIQELDGVQIGSVLVWADRVYFNSTRTTQLQSLEDLTTTQDGSIKLQSLSGDILVHSGTVGTIGIKAAGSGDILLESLAGDITLSAPVVSGTGHITLDARGSLHLDDAISIGSMGSVSLSSGETTFVDSISTAGGNIRIVSGKDIVLGTIDAGLGRVYLQATEDIKDADLSANTTNVIADSLAMRALGKIGNADPDSPMGNINRNAIGAQVAFLAAQSTNGIYIQEADGLSVDSVSVSTDRVNFNSSRTSQVQAMEDLVTTVNGPIKLQSLAGDISVNAGSLGTEGISANGRGDLLLETVHSGSIFINAWVKSDSGHITINSKENITVTDRLVTSGSGAIYLRSGIDASTGNLKAQGNIAVFSGRNIFLGSINAGDGRVCLEAGESILDANSTIDSIHIFASALAMKAGSKIGTPDLGHFEDMNRNAIVTSVDLIAAESSGGMYIQETDGVIVDKVSLVVQQVNFNSSITVDSKTLEDLTTTKDGSIKLQSVAGDIIVKEGTAGSYGVQADGVGDVLLQTLISGTVDLQAQARSANGDITINAFDVLEVQDYLRTQSPGRIYLASQKDVLLHSLNTGNTELAVVALRDIELGFVQAGTSSVYLSAIRNIVDMDPSSDSANVSAVALAMVAGNKIGDSDLDSAANINRHAIGTRVDQLAARSANGIYIRESDGLTVDAVLVATSKVHFNSSQQDNFQIVEDLTTTTQGPVKLQSVAGDIRIQPGQVGPWGILAAVSGDVLLQTLNSGTVILNAVIQTELGDVTIHTKDALVLDDKIRMGGPPKLGTIYLASSQGVTIQSLTTNDSSLWVESGSDIVLGTIQAGFGGVYLDAKQDIVSGAVASTVNVSTRSVLAMQAGSKIGPITTQVDFLSAVSVDGMTITEIDGVTIGPVALSVDQVHFNSSQTQRVVAMEDLITKVNGSILLESRNGDIVVEPGSASGFGISANGTGDIVLATISSGNILIKGDVSTQSGDISLKAASSVVLGAGIKTSGDVSLESVIGAVAELNSQARVEADLLVLKSGTFAHLHDASVQRLSSMTGSNAVLAAWQKVNLQASQQGDDFVDALGTVSQSLKDSLQANFRYAERFQDVGYSLYLVNSKELIAQTVVAGNLHTASSLSDRPGIYLETREGDLKVQKAIVSNSKTDQAGAVVIVSGSRVLLDSGATLQSNYVQSGSLELQRISNVDLKARVFDALEKPNPAGGLFTTRVVSRDNTSDSHLPEIPTISGPTKRQLQGVATHYGSADESGFDMFIGYADGKLESFAREGAIYLRDGANQSPVEAKPQALGRVGYLERSTPFDAEVLNSKQELPTDVVIRRSEDFFIFQKQQPVGFENFNPPNNPSSTSTGFYDLTVQSHRVPDVISEGSDSGLPMPPAPETAIPTFREPEPYAVAQTFNVITESAEYEDQPYEERKAQILIKRLVVNIVQEVQGDLSEESQEKDRLNTEDISIPEGLLSQSDQLSLADVRRIQEYLKLQPGTRQGKYEVILRTSDGTEQVIGSFIIRAEKSQDEDQELDPKPSSNPEIIEKSSNPNDQSLYLNPKNPARQITQDSGSGISTDQAWSLALGSLWLTTKSKQPTENTEIDFSIQARRLRRLRGRASK